MIISLGVVAMTDEGQRDKASKVRLSKAKAENDAL